MSVLVSEGIGYANLADDLQDEGPWKVHGVAIGSDDVTLGQSGIKKVWPGDSLREGASTLENTPLVANHINNDVYSVVGEILKAKFKEGVGVIYEGEIDEKDLAKKVDRGRLDVSPRIRHENVEEMEENADGAKIVEEVEFINLSLVPVGASPSASVSTGESSSLTAAELQQAFSETTEETEENSEVDIPSEEEESTQEATETTENNSEATENLAEHTVHEPDWSGTTESSWSKPNLEDFTDESWDDLDSEEKSDIGDHFLGSATGFPAENFGDMFLPVVEPNENLNLNALQNAKARVGQVSGLAEEDQERAENIINELANENFDADFEEEDNEMTEDIEFDVEEAGLHTFRMSLFDRPVPEDEANSVGNSLSGIDGVEAITKSGDDNPQVIVVIDPDEISDGLNDEIKDALDETPFAVRDDFDWVDRVVRNEGDRLADSDSIMDDVEFLGDDDSQDETSTEDIAELPILG